MLATRDEALLKRVQQLNNHGRTVGDMRQFWPSELGHKYKMANVQAALGCAQLERIDELVERKREIFDFYEASLLDALPAARMNPQPAGTLNSYWMPTLLLPSEMGICRTSVLESLCVLGIDSRIFFQPLSDTPVFNSIDCQWTPVAHDLALRGLNLPSYHDMSEQDLQRVVHAIISGIKTAGL